MSGGIMDKTLLVLAVAAAVGAGCAPIERSRNLADPAVPAVTLAQQVCSNCHGMDGNSVSPNFPRLAGQPADYLEAQLKLFRSHGRRDPAGFVYMWGLSRHLTDAQIAGLAQYFSGQHPTGNRPLQGPLAERGRDIFEHGIPAHNVPACSACHGAHGQGQGSFPRLAGQHADYIMKQLGVFQYRAELRPDAGPMKMVAHDLTPDNVRAVAAYTQGLQ
jgi:cytochrome c553